MDDIFGISSTALEVAEQRSVILSGNIANASTPNYKARDLDFQKILKQETDAPHSVEAASGELKTQPLVYRVPMQKSMDGNTVDEELERKNFLSNAINYQVSLTFIQNKSDQLLRAIKGE